MSEKQGKQKLRVVIVGGSLAGLTLAHCLEHLDIDFVLLEAGEKIAPEIGASIVILASGARILDQLGIWDDIEAIVNPLQKTLTWGSDGKVLVANDACKLVAARYVFRISGEQVANTAQHRIRACFCDSN